MKIYEKAIENYAKARKKFYRQAQKSEVSRFSRLVEKMAADGECPGLECRYCPIRLAFEEGIEVTSCGRRTPQEGREILAMNARKRKRKRWHDEGN